VEQTKQSTNNEPLARAIAADLFTNGMGDHAGRLMLESAGDRRDMGGWSEEAMVIRIKRILDKGGPIRES
jgi:hypothetical protein